MNRHGRAKARPHFTWHSVRSVTGGTLLPFLLERDYFSTRSLSVLPALKVTYFLAGMVMEAPVAGLRP